MIYHLSLPVALMLSTAALANSAGAAHRQTSEMDAIGCRLDAFTYRAFAFAAEGERIARKRGWS